MEKYTDEFGIEFTFRKEKDGYTLISCKNDRLPGYLIASVPEKFKSRRVMAIEKNAFQGEYVKHISIPSTISYISGRAFIDCKNLENILVEEENEFYTSENGILYTKDKGALVWCPPKLPYKKYETPKDVNSIFSNSFYHTEELEVLNVPNGKYFYAKAFVCCNMEEITIGNAEVLYDGAFSESYFDTVIFETIPLSANSPFMNCKINKLVIQDKEYNIPDWEAANEILKMCILTKDAFN